MTPKRYQEWRALVDEAKQVAVYQGPAFALTWYEVYASVYEPLVLLGIAEGDRLVGVLPLATHRERPDSLVFAGAEHCEYAGWLTAAALQDEFPAACVARLHELGHLTRLWDWGWLAPGAGVGWLEHPALRERGLAGRVRPAARPILALQEPDRAQYFGPEGKSFKQKVCWLPGLGEIRLVRPEVGDLSGDLFCRFTTAWDMRTLARYGSAPFSDDPRKGLFHRRLLERAPEATRFYVLLADDTPVAFHFGLLDKRRAISCMAPQDPRFAAALLGKVLGELVADALWAEGLDYLDHIPGGDAYKEEVATTHEAVFRVILYPTVWSARSADFAERLRANALRTAVAVGVPPGRLRALQAFLGRLRSHRAGSLAAAAFRVARQWVSSRRVSIVYRMDHDGWAAHREPGASYPVLREDHLEDFLHQSGSEPWRSRQQMMADAIQRLAEGEHAYTLPENGRLLHSAWLQMYPTGGELPQLGGWFRVPPQSAVVYDSYTEPAVRGRGLQAASLHERVRRAFEMGAQQVYSIAEESNFTSCRNIVRVGFRPERRLVRRRILGLVWRWEEPVAP